MKFEDKFPEAKSYAKAKRTAHTGILKILIKKEVKKPCRNYKWGYTDGLYYIIVKILLYLLLFLLGLFFLLFHTVNYRERSDC